MEHTIKNYEEVKKETICGWGGRNGKPDRIELLRLAYTDFKTAQ